MKRQLNSMAQELYPFSDPTQRNIFTKVIHELRCSVCQNQNLSDSMAPLAVDLRNEIYKKVQLHHSEPEIIEFVTSRYGEFVLYDPPLQWNTIILWFGPFFILIFGLCIFIKHVRLQ